MPEKCQECDSRLLRTGGAAASRGERPGLSALRRRIATHGVFKEAMKADIAAYPALNALSTRKDSDPSIALFDACAALLDVLTFYSERIFNEGFLRTATERLSIGELAAQIGYRLSPGVAATVPVAFTVEDAPGAPGWADIPKGARIQSVPGPGEKPQIFETTEKLTARAACNRLTPACTEPQTIRTGMTTLHLQGASLQLKPGDLLLIVGDERSQNAFSENWDARLLSTVFADTKQNTTVVTWTDPLGKAAPDGTVLPARQNPKVCVLRQRARLFGHNAQDPRVLQITDTALASDADWLGYEIDAAAQTIDLDAAYPKILPDSWVVLEKPASGDSVFREAYRITKASLASRADFALSSEITKLALDTNNHLNFFGLRNTVIYAQSEELALADIPLQPSSSLAFPLGPGMLPPVEGAQIVLSAHVPELQKGQLLIVSGRAARLRHLITGISGGNDKDLLTPERIAQIPETPACGTGKRKVLIQNPGADKEALDDHRLPVPEGEVPSAPAEYIPSDPDDAVASEAVAIASVATQDGKTVIYLQEALKNIYDRATVSIYGNCARAAHGETKREVLGSGDAAAVFQKFTLAQTPLTYVPAAASGGSVSSLEVRVNDIAWREVPFLYGQDAQARVFVTRAADDGKVTVSFGDGITGARLPSGVENVTAVYRIGTGSAGRIGAGRLCLLLTRPLGVKAVVNPGPAAGGEDPESRDEARASAPSTVLTFDRIVSLADYESFIRRFAGIGKACAAWLWTGGIRLVHITVAAADGGPVPADSELFANLRRAVKNCGIFGQPFLLQSGAPLKFSLAAKVMIKQGRLEDKVIAAARRACEDHFSFARRSYGQGVSAGEVIALLQSTDGVEMVDLDFLGRSGRSGSFLTARPARVDAATGLIAPAEILTVDPAGIELIALVE